MIHSASLWATGSLMLLSAASASAPLPLRAASITRFTASISAGKVVVAGATANAPEPGRAIGLNMTVVANSEPRKPTLAWAKADWALSFSGRLTAGAVWRGTGGGRAPVGCGGGPGGWGRHIV